MPAPTVRAPRGPAACLTARPHRRSPAIPALVLVLAALLGTAGPAWGQRVAEWGIRAGVTRSTLDNGPRTAPFHPFGTYARVGYTAGVFAVVPLRGALAAQPEVLLTRTGAAVAHWPAFTRAARGTMDLTYVEVPVLARLTWRPPGVRSGSGRVYAGPTLRLKVAEAYGGHDGDGAAARRPAEPLFTRTDYGGTVGAAMAVGRGRAQVLLDARFVVGMANVARRPDYLYVLRDVRDRPGQAAEPKSRAVVFSVGLAL